jgi:antitoxin (DNA-binding transcriptional repressor) of toxin-antitoxin stability system
LKNNLSRYLDHVKAGGTVLVLERDRPVAQIVPWTPRKAETGSDDRLLRLERRGLIRRGTGGLPEWLGTRKPPKLRGSVLQDLLKEREAGW